MTKKPTTSKAAADKVVKNIRRNRKLMAAGSVDHGNDPVLWHQLIKDEDRLPKLTAQFVTSALN